MLPGVSAKTAQRLAFLIPVIAPLLLIFVIGAFFLEASEDTTVKMLLAIPVYMVVVGGILVAITRFANRRERLEIDAGYTTMRKHYNDLDCLSPRTGRIVRRAMVADVSLRPSASRAASNSIGKGSAEGRVDVQVALRNPIADIVLAVALIGVILGVRALLMSDGAPHALLPSGLVIGGLAVILIPLFLFGWEPSLYYARAMREHFPGHQVWATQSASALRIAANDLTRADPSAEVGAHSRVTSYLVVAPERITFWSRQHTTMLPYLSIPRSRLDSVESGVDLTAGGFSVPAVTFAVRKDNGTLLQLTISLVPKPATPGRIKLELSDAAAWLEDWHRAG
jgi:hypothetical protein